MLRGLGDPSGGANKKPHIKQHSFIAKIHSENREPLSHFKVLATILGKQINPMYLMKGKSAFMIAGIVIVLLPAIVYGQLTNLPRIIVSTDIGGDDPDDYQSLVHLFLYGDRFDIAGLISSPPGGGRMSNIEEVLMAYERDYQRLKQHANFPAPSHLRDITKQGAIGIQREPAPSALSEGAAWIIKKALETREDPLYLLVWGSLTDVAQAVHARPEIKKHIRLYTIGSWNTEQDPHSRNYLFNFHPDLWWIENNTTFRGMYVGGFQKKRYSNTSFVEYHVKNYGALGALFWNKKNDIKMGDTPSVLYFLYGDITNPEGESWGGSFVKDESRPNFWTDKQGVEWTESGKAGAKTVNVHRKAFLNDWKKRMRWTIK